MNRQQLLENLKKDIYLRLGPSEIHKVGVFAIRDIPKGTNPFKGSHDLDEYFYSQEELKDVPSAVKRMIKDYFVTENGQVAVPSCGLNGIDISYFVNHSDDPNLSYNDKDELAAVRNIKKGEEVTFHYVESFGEENRPS